MTTRTHRDFQKSGRVIKGFGLLERKAIAVFKYKTVVRPNDLPVGVGLQTMASLVDRGLVQVIEAQSDMSGKRRAWQLGH